MAPARPDRPLRCRCLPSDHPRSAVGRPVAYGLTGKIYAASPAARNEIVAGLQPDEPPERKPFILAGYQSEDEAKAELAILPADAATARPRPQCRVTGL